MATWKELKKDFTLTQEDQNAIELEKELIRTMIKIREEKGLTQSQLAEICNIKQPVIARMESAVHSPQINSLLKILAPLGYTLQIVPIKKEGRIPFEVAVDPFYSQENMIRLKESVAQMEATGGTVHEVDLND